MYEYGAGAGVGVGAAAAVRWVRYVWYVFAQGAAIPPMQLQGTCMHMLVLRSSSSKVMELQPDC